MKNIFKAACWAGLVLLGACGKKDAELIGQLPVSTAVNPATGVLIKGSGLINVQMDGVGAIRGIADSSRFSTTDNFATFQYYPVQAPAGAQFNYRTIYTSFSGMNILAPAYIEFPAPIGYSTDYGATWHTVTPNPPVELTFNYFSWQLEGLQYQAGRVLVAATQFGENYSTDQNSYLMLVYSVDPGSGQTVKLLERPNCLAESLTFTSPDTGYIILDTLNLLAGNGVTSIVKGFFMRTTDGGATWSKPVVLNANEPYKLATGPHGRLLAYDGDGTVAYSTDAGASWKAGNIGQPLYTAFIADDNTIYGGAEDGLIKTTDFGGSWKPITTPMNEPYFYFVDARHGIAYREWQLYSTSDGGASWKTLLYPYSYVKQ